MEFAIELYESPDGRPVVEEELEALEHENPTLHVLLVAGINKLRRLVPDLTVCIADEDGHAVVGNAPAVLTFLAEEAVVAV